MIKRHRHQRWDQNILLTAFRGGSKCREDYKTQRLWPGRDLQERQQRMSGCVPASPFPPRCHVGQAQTPVRITLVSSLTRALFGMSSPLANRLPSGSRAQTPGADTPQNNGTTTHLPRFTATERRTNTHGFYLKQQTGDSWVGLTALNQ